MLKSFFKPSSECLPPLHDTDSDTMVADANAKASLLNSFFVTRTRLNENDHALPTGLSGNDQNSLTSILIESMEVRDVLTNLNVGKAPGPDGINNTIFREPANQSAKPLCQFFNFGLETSKLPLSWKMSNVCPVFKNCDPSLTSNYRPISLLDTMEKVLKGYFLNIFSVI